jgi:protein ImuB
MCFGGGDTVGVRVDSSGAPASVLVGVWRTVVRSWGPERVETGWWRGRRLRRDAYWVDLEDGRRLWLSFDLGSRRWSLAGEFC